MPYKRKNQGIDEIMLKKYQNLARSLIGAPLIGGLGSHLFSNMSSNEVYVLIPDERYQYLLKIEKSHDLISKRLIRLRKSKRKVTKGVNGNK